MKWQELLATLELEQVEMERQHQLQAGHGQSPQTSGA